MQADVKRRYRPPVHPSSGHSHNRKVFAAQPCWWLAGALFGRLAYSRRLASRLVIFFPFGKYCRYPDEASDVRGGKI